jgi:hypothetical protein
MFLGNKKPIMSVIAELSLPKPPEKRRRGEARTVKFYRKNCNLFFERLEGGGKYLNIIQFWGRLCIK